MKRAELTLPFIVLSGALGIFVAPWFVPHRQPVYSASYVLGFNNAVAILAFAALLAAIFEDRSSLFTVPLEIRNRVSAIPASVHRQRWDSTTVKPATHHYCKMLPFNEDLRRRLQFKSVGTPSYTQEDVDRAQGSSRPVRLLPRGLRWC